MRKTITCTYKQHTCSNNNIYEYIHVRSKTRVLHSTHKATHWCICGAVFSSCLFYNLGLLGGRWTALCHIILCTHSKILNQPPLIYTHVHVTKKRLVGISRTVSETEELTPLEGTSSTSSGVSTSFLALLPLPLPLLKPKHSCIQNMEREA